LRRKAFVERRHEGYQTDWSARLKSLDKEAGRKWRTGTASVTEGGLSSVPAEDHKSPENYYWTYKKRGLFAMGAYMLPERCLVARCGSLLRAGILRAIRNIASAHASDYVADHAFGSLEDVFNYFLRSFPWLLLEVLQARQLGKGGPHV
jgi:hypothetical protein